MATLVVRYPDGRTEEHPLEGSVTVGRAEGNGLVLPEGGVSRRHAQFTAVGADVYVEDAGSSNGTWLDGERVQGRVKVPPRGVVKIGDYEVMVGGAGARAGAPATRAGARQQGSAEATSVRPTVAPRATKVVPAVKRPAPAGGTPGARPAPPPRPAGGAGGGAEAGPHLRGVNGPWNNKVYPLRGKVAVGRVPQAQVFLDDESVSRRHAEIARGAAGFLVVDLGSANGTHLNGEPLAPNEPAPLQSGDSIQFGVVELVFDPGESAALAPAPKGGRPAVGGAPGRGGPPARPPARGGSASAAESGKKRLLLAAGGAVALLLVVAVVLKSGGGDGEQAGAGEPQQPPPPADPAAELNALVSECRTYSTLDGTVEADWVRAEKACARALELEPIHPEALALAKRIRVEKEAVVIYREAEKHAQRNRHEDALAEYARLPADSAYYRKARPRVRESVDKIRKPLGDDCLNKVRDHALSSAFPRCELFMQLACCDLGEEFLNPPPGAKVILDGTPGRTTWKPDDKAFEGKVYIAYMRSKQQERPGEPLVHACTGSRIFCSYEQRLADPRQEIMEHARKRFTDKGMQEALVAYWKGNEGEAVLKLQRVRETREKAALHAEVDTLRRDVQNVANLYKTGGTDLQKSKVLDADAVFAEALEIDARIMQEMALKRPSTFRQNINKDMAVAALAAGRTLASQRNDEKRACQLFKLGLKYSRSELDLLTASYRCSERAAGLRTAADATCESLALAEALAVEGDGNKEKIDARKAELGCQ